MFPAMIPFMIPVRIRVLIKMRFCAIRGSTAERMYGRTEHGI
jgi:hypothetical protein